MKTTVKITLAAIVLSFNSIAQSVGINSTGTAPDNSALLDLSSIDKGFLITRTDTLSIVSPAFGLMTLAPSDSCLYMFSGATWIRLGGVGENCSCCSSTLPPVLPTFPCNGTVIPVVDITNPTTGKTWMDRNLGASQVATSSTDAAAYGDLYQWGRCSDGHEKRNSGGTTTTSSGDTPGHGDFISNSNGNLDWRTTPNDNLWQGAAGVNNPCPSGYRLPTDIELDDERLSWTSNNAAGAFNSPLKLTLGGMRNLAPSLIDNEGVTGYYWSSTVSISGFSRDLKIDNTSAVAQTSFRFPGWSIRCIKD